MLRVIGNRSESNVLACVSLLVVAAIREFCFSGFTAGILIGWGQRRVPQRGRVSGTKDAAPSRTLLP